MQAKIIKVNNLLENSRVVIPDYQRPYKWGPKNVNALIDDLIHFKDTESYRLGTVVYYQNGDKLELVDGQQRSITLSLILKAICEDDRLVGLAEKYSYKLPKNSAVDGFSFSNPISKGKIIENYKVIQRRIIDFDFKTVQFLFSQCEFVKVEIGTITEAFQFFDSQNARGRDLDPHDLLKAFHLREIDSNVPERELNAIISEWENIDSSDLVNAFALYLFRVRNWSKGKSARYFTKNNVDEFKGVSPSIKEPFPYAVIYRVAHHYIEGYNRSNDRNIDLNTMSFPFQIDQVVINGKRFFEMVIHYVRKIKELEKSAIDEKTSNDSTSRRIMQVINTYDARNRTGDKYVRSLFDAALFYYIDKFGFNEIDRAIEKIFIWAYSLRLKRQSVQLASIDNSSLEYPFVFKTLREALNPSDFLNVILESLDEQQFAESNRTGKLTEIVNLFKELKFVNA